MHLMKSACVILFLILIGSSYGMAQPSLREALRSSSEVELYHSKLDPKFLEGEQSPKSVMLAVLYSLVLPGMGELYADNFSTGKYALIAEAGLWLTYGGFQGHGQWLKQDAKLYASQHASAQFEGKDEQFEVNIGNFNTVDEYNEAKLRNRQYNQMYDPNSNYAWRWDGDASRLQFKNLRIRGDEVLQNSKFVLGALVLNRIISAFSAGRAAAAYNKALQSEGAWRLDANVTGGVLNAHGIELRVIKEF